MSTNKQIVANRRNAQRSTGPKTPEGKARSSLNAVRHGLLARQSVIPEEDRDQFLALLSALTAEHQPVGPEETYLVEQIASAQWRMERLTRIETGFITSQMEKVREYEREDDEDVDEDDEDDDQEDDDQEDDSEPAPLTPNQQYDENTRLLGVLFNKNCASDPFARLARYEGAIQRTYFRSLKTLLELQAHRPQPPAPPPENQKQPNEPKSPRDQPAPNPSNSPAPPPAPHNAGQTNPISPAPAHVSASPTLQDIRTVLDSGTFSRYSETA